MSKGLEALEELKCVLSTNPGTKRYSDIFNDSLINPIEKELKALGIIKDKQVDIHNLLDSKTCEQYNGFAHWLGYKGSLTQKEYELLKEVLE